MKLRDYPIYINNEKVAMEPTSWSETNEIVEASNTTEAGVDIVDVKRVNKLSISAGFNVSSVWLAKFSAWSRALSPLVVRIYDATAGDYVSRNMRIRNFSYNYVANSSNTSATVGLWEITFNLLEF